MSQEELLKSIDAKLNALLAIVLDKYLRDTELARPLHPNVDTMLRDAGLSAKEIAALLGKTPRAVTKMWNAGKDS